ncbi:MAG TPA: hypothetical protein VK252_05885 [Solirubrobacteraceae bacterium]|nr:hypothetical protein [Solirubrobacteraceae bacterium]
MIRALRRRVSYIGIQRERRRYLRSLVERGDDPAFADEQPLSADMDDDSRTLLIAFGGMNQEVGITPFEFFGQASDIPVKRLFVRDLRQAWYHRGLPGHGTTLASVTQTLRELISANEVQRLVVTGNSAGGYAALLFGTLLGADTVLSFAPQTTLDMSVLAGMGDHRWDDYLQPLVDHHALDPRWVDLHPALEQARRAHDLDTRYLVFFAESLSTDRLHAERLVGLDGLRLYRFGKGEHYLVSALRDAGALKRILRHALLGAGTEAGGGHGS